MRWFKHHYDLNRQADVAAFMEACGEKDALQGYGFLNLLLELVTEQMTPDNPDPVATFSLRLWSHHLYCHHLTVDKYLGKLEETGVVTVEKDGSDLRVTVPELSNCADEYMRKSGHAPDNVAQNRTDKIKRDEREKLMCSLPDDFSLTDERRQRA